MSTDPGTKVIFEQLLRTVGSSRDVDQYLQLYGGEEKQRFAVIKVGGEVIQKELDTLAHALTFLHRAGLFPIVVHGAGPQMNAVLEKEGYEPQYVGGMRVTDEHALATARRVFLETNLKLVQRLGELGTPARPISSGVFEAEVIDEQTGFVGSITDITKTAIQSSIDAGCLPILLPLAETRSGQILNINADVAAREVAIAFQPMKTIFINAKGGWLEEDGTKLSVIDMNHDYEKFLARDYTGRQGTLLKLKELKLILDHLPASSSIALTSASGLVKELFTHRGAGTMVTKGEAIHVFNSLAEANISKEELCDLLQASNLSAKGLLHESYLEQLLDPNQPQSLFKLYLSETRSAGAILTRGLEGGNVPYLDKFAISEQGLGNGTGDALWNRIAGDHPRFFWRSTKEANKEITAWYMERATAVHSVGIDKMLMFFHSSDGTAPDAVTAECIQVVAKRALAYQ